MFKDIPSVKNLKNKSFHYCEDNQDVKHRVIRLIAQLPFNAYICYKLKRHDFCPSHGFDWYDQLFGKLMYDRLLKHKKSSINIIFEQHGKSREKELEGVLQRVIDDIESKNTINFSIPPIIKSAGKEESCLAVADYVAAVFKDYESVSGNHQNVSEKDKQSTWQSRNFAMLSPKIRVIHNYETGEFFTRRNLFP